MYVISVIRSSFTHYIFSLQRYLMIKKMTPAERKKLNPRVVFFAGKAAPACQFPLFS